MRKLRSQHAFTLMEILVSTAILALLLVGLTSLLGMTMRSYTRTTGKLETFEASRAAFDTMARMLRQATLLSYLGYNDPTAPTAFQLKSDLHFLSGPQSDLSLSQTGAGSTHAVFFQAPLGVADTALLQPATSLLNAVGFFLAYGDDPYRPSAIQNLTPQRFRYRLFQYLQPRENMTVYQYTIHDVGGILVGNTTYSGTDWFKTDVGALTGCQVLAENVVALAILPVPQALPGQAQSVPTAYLWNSRTSSNQLPRALKIVMAVIDEASAARLGNASFPPPLLPSDLFTEAAKFEDDVIRLEKALSEHTPLLNFQIFRAEVALPPANANL